MVSDFHSTAPQADRHFDPFDPAVIRDPYPALARLQASAPVAWSDNLKAWIVTGYAETRDLLRDRRISSDRIAPYFTQLSEADRRRLTPLGEHLRRWLVFMDPPEHTRLRSLMSKAFTPRAVARLRAAIGDVVDELLDRVQDKQHWDVIADLGYPLPAIVIADLLGVPRQDVDHLKRWSDDLGAFVLTARMDMARHDRAAAAVQEMEGYFGNLVRHRRAARRDDLISGLVAAEEAGDFLSVEELVAACVLLLFAGHETTTHLIGNGLLALLQHPEQMAVLRARLDDPAAVRNAIEEMLRFDGPVLSVTRNVAEDVEVADQRLCAGERLFFVLAAADRDPAVFDDPHRFDISRAGPSRHVDFAYGIHFCLGAPLARLEGEIAFPRLLRRFPKIAVADPGPEWSDSLVIRGLTHLPVSTGRA